MQVPKRKAEEHRKYHGPEDDFLSPQTIARLRAELVRLEADDRPKAVTDLSHAREMGDLSENAAYSEAKGRLIRIDNRRLTIKEKLKRAVVIEGGAAADGSARLGSTVTVEVKGQRRTYQLVGAQETDPTKGRISLHSPLGSILMRKKPGETVIFKGPAGEVEYKIIDIS